jgi:hypothetical protein
MTLISSVRRARDSFSHAVTLLFLTKPPRLRDEASSHREACSAHQWFVYSVATAVPSFRPVSSVALEADLLPFLG